MAEGLEKFETEILSQWVKEQKAATTIRPDPLTESELWEQSRRFLSALRNAVQSGSADITAASWSVVCDVLGGRFYSPDEDAVNRLNPSPRLWFLFTAAQTQHLRSLAARELLQEDFATVGKTDPITVCECFQALLNKCHFFDLTHTQAPLQILGDVGQSQPRAWWHTHGWEAGREY